MTNKKREECMSEFYRTVGAIDVVYAALERIGSMVVDNDDHADKVRQMKNMIAQIDGDVRQAIKDNQ